MILSAIKANVDPVITVSCLEVEIQRLVVPTDFIAYIAEVLEMRVMDRKRVIYVRLKIEECLVLGTACANEVARLRSWMFFIDVKRKLVR